MNDSFSRTNVLRQIMVRNFVEEGDIQHFDIPPALTVAPTSFRLPLC